MPAPERMDKFELRLTEVESDFGEAVLQIRQTLEEIRAALVGDLEGNDGLMNRAKTIEARITLLETRTAKLEIQNADTERKKWFITVVGTGLCFLVFKGLDWLMASISKH